MVFDVCERTDRHTDTLIAILRSAVGSEVNTRKVVPHESLQVCRWSEFEIFNVIVLLLKLLMVR